MEPGLKTAHLRLCAYEERDITALAELLTNEQIRRTYMIPELKTPEHLQAMCRKLLAYSRSGEHFEYGIFRKDTDELIGFLNDCELDPAQGLCELGYVIPSSHWGKGYATDALQTAIDELLRMGYRMIRACWFAENPASGRVIEKCGMTRLPDLREEVYQGAGAFRHIYGAAEGQVIKVLLQDPFPPCSPAISPQNKEPVFLAFLPTALRMPRERLFLTTSETHGSAHNSGYLHPVHCAFGIGLTTLHSIGLHSSCSSVSRSANGILLASPLGDHGRRFRFR